MQYAIDLNPRQSSRTLEQAVRHQAHVVLQPRIHPEDVPILCRLTRIEHAGGQKGARSYLVLVPENSDAADPPTGTPACGSPTPETLNAIVGTYCDAIIQLGENRYLFSSDVLGVTGVHTPSEEKAICVGRPEVIQVTQRRRFWRFRPARSSQVEIRWKDADGMPAHGIGWLCNVSADGVACRVETHVADRLGVGEELTVRFGIAPGETERFTIDASLCSKTPAGTEGTLILGLHFCTGAGHESSAQRAEELGRLLMTRYAQLVDLPKGADT